MRLQRVCVIVALATGACAMPHGETPSDPPAENTFATPQEAMNALVESAEDPAHADALLGPGGADALCNCDADDSDDLAEVRAKMEEQVKFADAGPDLKHVLIGSDEWELPLPLVRTSDRWHFDIAAGKEELLSRTIGFNELHAIATLRELVNAQNEFDAMTREGDKREFAQKWSSSPGRHDGLYWESKDEKSESPIGPLLAGSAGDGADPSESGPCQGFFFRILKSQGAHACGGAKSYVDADGNLSAGFAFIAWPAEYGVTGVMSFQVNRIGIVFEKDLGETTAEAVKQIAAFDPDASWEPVRD